MVDRVGRDADIVHDYRLELPVVSLLGEDVDMVQIVGIAASMNHLGDVHHGRCPGRSVDGHIPVRIGQQAVVIGMVVADEDGIGFLRPFEGLAADLLLLLLGPGVEIERQTQIEQDFCLRGPYLDTTAPDFVCSAVDGDGHSNFTVMRGLYI